MSASINKDNTLYLTHFRCFLQVYESLLITDICNKNNSNLSIKYGNVFLIFFFYVILCLRGKKSVFERSNIYGLFEKHS